MPAIKQRVNRTAGKLMLHRHDFLPVQLKNASFFTLCVVGGGIKTATSTSQTTPRPEVRLGGQVEIGDRARLPQKQRSFGRNGATWRRPHRGSPRQSRERVGSSYCFSFSPIAISPNIAIGISAGSPLRAASINTISPASSIERR